MDANVVFGAQKGKLWAQMLGYYALVIVVAVLGSLGVRWGTTAVHMNEYIVKIIVDVLLSILSFVVQRMIIFRPIRKKA